MEFPQKPNSQELNNCLSYEIQKIFNKQVVKVPVWKTKFLIKVQDL